ncbi:MAG: hypothetical protein DIZ78_09550 [endosymbiont of Escarpia spicata]|uniref:Uncharacterized protein n=1 Tax=endosymbiont of Escarpia spicata TaxID=2200908 RepID=A0A370DNJ0_9GAMM|nr:MAG: hypothetical protein DIZ78_09550 [endosymbiont of Escarpia spicata]
MWDLILGIVLLLGVLALFAQSVLALRYLWAHKKASDFIRERGYTNGPYVKHGMVIDPKTGLVRGTSAPSDIAIRKFL